MHIHFDVVGGASGDMILAALIELGANPVVLGEALKALDVEAIHLHVEKAGDRGIHGTRVTVHAHENAAAHHHHNDAAPREHAHYHHHDDTVPHVHSDDHAHDEAHQHPPHRNIRDIQRIIESVRLPDTVKQSSLDVFRRIAEAEAKIHGTHIDQIHFHEVGALDSIADIVGCCLGHYLLGVTGVSISALPMGHGTITCAHGTYPNPAPATLELAKGLPVRTEDEPHELVTPTAAALFAAWRTTDHPPDGARITRTGYAIGHRALQRLPNVLRVIQLEDSIKAAHADTCVMLECNLDDVTPEVIGALTEHMRECGALDVYTTPVQMKKHRPGVVLSVLCRPADRETMLELIFTESTTFGVREMEVRRAVLDRREETVSTPYGVVRVKTGIWNGREVTHSPEMEDCVARARDKGVAPRAVYQAAQQAAG